MLDNVATWALGGAVICALFVIFELIAKWKGWE